MCWSATAVPFPPKSKVTVYTLGVQDSSISKLEFIIQGRSSTRVKV